jgi:hypothetical protein
MPGKLFQEFDPKESLTILFKHDFTVDYCTLSFATLWNIATRSVSCQPAPELSSLLGSKCKQISRRSLPAIGADLHVRHGVRTKSFFTGDVPPNFLDLLQEHGAFSTGYPHCTLGQLEKLLNPRRVS